MRIRRLTRRDLPALAVMVAEFEMLLARMAGKRRRIDAKRIRHRLLQHGFGPRRFFGGLIAEEKGEAAGYLLYHFGFTAYHYCGTLTISDFFVREGGRRTGTGRALMERAKTIARTRGCERIEWTVWNINAPAIAFYRAMGADAVSDELSMGLDLTK